MKRHLDNLQGQAPLIAELEASYKSALEGIERNLPSVSAQLVEHFRTQIRELRMQFEQRPALEVLAQSRHRLRDAQSAFATQANKILEDKNKQFREIMRSFAEAATTLAKQSTTNNRRLTGFTRNLDDLIELQDLSEIRKGMEREVAALKRAVAEIHDASQQSAMQLHAELQQFQDKLARSEEIAHTDMLTGLGNRRAAEQALRLALRAAKPFSVVLVDLNGFKGVNDRWGHPTGDAVLREFGRRLGSVVRSTDLACRWGGDEFLVLLPACSLAQAMVRSQQISRVCEGDYRVTLADGQITLLLRAAMGVTEWFVGEQMESLIRRADDALYKDKGKSSRRYCSESLTEARLA